MTVLVALVSPSHGAEIPQNRRRRATRQNNNKRVREKKNPTIQTKRTPGEREGERETDTATRSYRQWGNRSIQKDQCVRIHTDTDCLYRELRACTDQCMAETRDNTKSYRLEETRKKRRHQRKVYIHVTPLPRLLLLHGPPSRCPDYSHGFLYGRHRKSGGLAPAFLSLSFR